MRLDDRTVRVIVSFFLAHDPHARIHLYGSRVRDDLRGGDIDLIVISEVLGFTDKIDALSHIKQELGDQRIDLRILTAPEAAADPFIVEVLREAQELTRS